MKVLIRNEVPKNKVYVFTCHNCTSKLEAEKDEGQIHYDQRDGNYITFICPVCKESNSISELAYKKT